MVVAVSSDIPTRVDPGHYRVHETTSEDEKKSTSETKQYGVVRGDVANDDEHGLFANQIGFRSSKWYAYCATRTSVQPALRFSPTAPTNAFEKSFTEIRFAQQEFDTKKAAVEHAENEMVDGYRY